MAKVTRGRKYVGVITRRIVADNLAAALKVKYGERKNHAERFEEDYGVTYSQTVRILKCELGVSIDILEQICSKLQIPVHQLFVPPAEMVSQLTVRGSDNQRAARPPIVIRATDKPSDQAAILKVRRAAR